MPASSTTRRSWSSPHVPAVRVGAERCGQLCSFGLQLRLRRAERLQLLGKLAVGAGAGFSISAILRSTFSSDSLSGLTSASMACCRLPSSSVDCWWSFPNVSRRA